MTFFKKRNLLREESGATGIEYAIIASLIAVAAAGAMTSLGGEVTNHYSMIEQEVAAAR